MKISYGAGRGEILSRRLGKYSLLSAERNSALTAKEGPSNRAQNPVQYMMRNKFIVEKKLEMMPIVQTRKRDARDLHRQTVSKFEYRVTGK